MSAVLQPVADVEAPVPGPSLPACPNRDCPRFEMPAGFMDDGTEEPVGGPCPACSANTDQVPATVWALPSWVVRADTEELDDSVSYQTLVGEVPSLGDGPILVEASGSDMMCLADLSVRVVRQPSTVIVAERRVTPTVARELAALLTKAADMIEGTP